MSFETLITLKRNTATIAQHVPVRIDNVSPRVAMEAGGGSPYQSYELLTEEWNLDIRTSDLVIDEQNTDPLIPGNPQVQYTVFGNPEPGEDIFVAVLIEKLIGKTPL